MNPEEISVPILCYHRVVPDGQEDSVWTLSVAEFRRHVERLAADEYQTISLSDFCQWQTQRTPLPPKPVILTFDDGQERFLERVAPILLEHEFRATLFLIAGMLGSEVQLRGGPPFRTMPPNEATRLSDLGFEIQTHGSLHRDWTEATSKEVQVELADSVARLQDLCGRPVQFAAYPYGRWNVPVRRLVEASGLAGACTTEAGKNSIRQDPFLLKRNVVLARHGDWLRPWIGQQLRGLYNRMAL